MFYGAVPHMIPERYYTILLYRRSYTMPFTQNRLGRQKTLKTQPIAVGGYACQPSSAYDTFATPPPSLSACSHYRILVMISFGSIPQEVLFLDAAHALPQCT